MSNTNDNSIDEARAQFLAAKQAFDFKNAVKHYLESTRLEDVRAKRDLVSVKPHDTITHVLNTLGEANLQAAPIIDPETGKCTGVVDTVDVVQKAVQKWTKDFDEEKQKASSLFEIIQAIAATDEKFGIKHAKEVANATGWCPEIVVRGSETIGETVNVLFANGFHRVMVSDDSGHVKGIVTQSAVAAHLASKMELEKGEWGGLARTAVKDIKGAMTNKIVSHKADGMALDAYQLMFENDVSAVPIVDNDGKLIATLSGSDLKGYGQHGFAALIKPIQEFTQCGPEQIVCTKETSFIDALRLLVSKHVHRLWVVDDERRPVGVVSLTNIMAALAGDSLLVIEEEA